MANFDHRTNRFIFLGLFLAAAGDVVGEGFYTYATNIRSYQQGVITSRKGMSAIGGASGAGAIHSIKRLNNDLSTASQAFARFRGAGTTLESDNSAHNAFTQRATGFSGNPLTMIPFRPSESPEPYLYVGDSTKIIKAKVDGTTQNWGIAAPSTPPTAVLAAFAFNVYGSLSTGAANGWSASGTATASSTNQSRTNTTITRLLYDSGSTGWVSVQPASFNEINVGARITFDVAGANIEQCLVEQVFESAHTTTISSIKYDSGTTGACTIVLSATSKTGLRKDACLLINASEMIRITDVVDGPNNSFCIRSSTVSSHAAGESVTGIATFRCVTANTQSAGNTITETVHRLSVTSGLGYYSNTINIDASVIGNRPMTPNDFIHIGIKMDLPANLVEGKLLLDCDSTTNDFTKNYYYFAFNANDFTPAVNDQITTLQAKQAKIQRRLIDLQNRNAKQAKIDALTDQLANLAARLKELQSLAATPPLGLGSDSSGRFQTVAGASQWTEFFIRLDDNHLTRVGSDLSRGLANIKAIRLQFNVSATTIIDVADFYIGGGYETEVTEVGTPYIWRYRYRSSTTGTRSAWSPPMKNGMLPMRQQVTLTPTTSGDSQVDKIDWIRFGGTLNRWIYVGTTANSGTFADESGDASLLGKPEIDVTEIYQPFVTQDIPRTTVVNVVGISVSRSSGDNFNVNWIEGTPIIIDGVECHIYSVSSTSLLFIKENRGTLASITAFIPSPEIAAQPLPIIFGPFLFGEAGSVMFGLGDTQNSGTLYWTNPDNPDGMRDINSLDVTSPSEPLMTGGLLDGRAFIFSNKKLYWIYPRQVGDEITFYVQESGCEKGIIGRWAYCIGEGMIYFASEDGIYATSGGEPKRITDRIYQVFPHDGQVGSSTNGVIAPDYAHPETFQLSYGDSYLFFDYLGLDSAYHTLVADLKVPEPAWSNDEYSPTVRVHYFEEGKGVHNLLLGASDGRLYSNSGFGDGASPTTNISCQLRSGAEDFGSPRAKKILGDVLVDYDPQGISISAQLGIDNYSTLPAPTGLLSTVGRRQGIIDIGSGAGLYGKNIALDLTWSSAVAAPFLYLWESAYIPKPEDTEKRATDVDNLGTEHAKWIQGFRIRCNTYNVSKSFKVQADTGTNGVFTDIQTFSITSNGESIQAFSFDIPFIAHLVRIIGNDTNDWSLINYEFVWEVIPELVQEYITQPTGHGLHGFKHYRDAYIGLISNANVTYTLILDGVSYSYTIASTANQYQKVYVPLQAIKFKTAQHSLTCASGFRLFILDSEIKVKEWGSMAAYQIIHPFGDQHNNLGATI